MLDSLQGDGIRLRPWDPADAPSVAPICGDPEVCAWDHLPWAYDRDQVVAWIERQRDAHAAGSVVSLAITAPGSDLALGWVGLYPAQDAERTWSIGYWIVPEARRRGLTLRAAQALVAHAFHHGAADRITLETGPHNIGSQRIAEALGGRLRPANRIARDRTGALHEQLVYEITPTRRGEGTARRRSPVR